MYKDANFNVKLTNNNVQIGEKVYVKVTSGVQASSYKMRLNTCVAKPYSSSSDSSAYTLIRDGYVIDMT